MIKASALALLGAMTFTTAAQMHGPFKDEPFPADNFQIEQTVQAPASSAAETITVYYSPLTSTVVARLAGFGMAYHMAVVYTDKSGRSFGASSGPSDLKSPQTPRNAFGAFLYMASEEPSSFGTLVSDPRNDTAFVKDGRGDFYTHDAQGRPFPASIVRRGADLSAQWASIVRTYAAVGRLGLTYAPMSQNSNTVAATALRRAGIAVDFSSRGYFAPGTFTQLPEG